MMSLAGMFLVARKSLKDGFFGRSVILMLQQGPDGAFGLMLTLRTESEKLPFPVHIGGPCKFNGFILVHGQADWVDEGERESAQICPGVYLGNAECLSRVTDPESTGDWRYRVFTGYSGWGPGQLERELAEGSWAVVPARDKLVFDIPVEELWIRLAPSPIPQPSLN